MITTSDMKMKEVINIYDGSRVGYVYDFEINFTKGRVESIIVPSEGRFLKFFAREDEEIVPWKRIVRIGEDVILVEMRSNKYLTDDDFSDNEVVDKKKESIKASESKENIMQIVDKD